MRSAPYIFALAVTGASTALGQVGFDALRPCAEHAVGTEFCSPDAARAALDGIEPAWGNRFRQNAPYAIVTSLGTLREGLDARLTSDCDAAELAAYEASELWAWYIGDLPEGVSINYEMDFSILRRFSDNVTLFLSNGDCN